MFLKPNADIVVVYNMLCKLTFPLGNWSIHFELRNKCDLLREKGPNAVKRRFKTQLTAFSLYMLCNIFTSTSQSQLNAFHSRKEKKKKKAQLISFS